MSRFLRIVREQTKGFWEEGDLHNDSDCPESTFRLAVVKTADDQHADEVDSQASEKAGSAMDVFTYEPTRHDDDTSQAKTTNRDIETVDSGQTSGDQEVDRLREESSASEVGCCVDEHHSKSTLQIRPFETIKVRAPLMLRVVLFSDQFNQVCKASFGVVFRAVNKTHHFMCLLVLVIVDEIYRRLGCHCKREDKDQADSPLNSENVAEGLLCDVRDEGADYTKSSALHEDGEKDECGLDWCTKLKWCDLIFRSVQEMCRESGSG
jgi:hypothetical protein